MKLSIPLLAALLSLPAPAQAATDMTAYIGQHPARAVQGVAFIDHPAVIALVERALDDERDRALVLKQTRDHAYATDIFESAGKIYFFAYDPSGTATWGIAISPDGEDGAVCIAQAPYGETPTQGDWHRDGQIVAVSPGGCPDSANGLAEAFGG